MLIDTHIHTNRYSACSILEPHDLVRKAIELGLSGIVITEHHRLWSRREIEALKRDAGSKLKIFRGQEVACPMGHLLIYGYYEKLDGHLRLDQILSKVHDKGGIVIMAHPFRYGHFMGDTIETLQDSFNCFDGIEVLNGNQTANENEYSMKVWTSLRESEGVLSLNAGLGGSDAHSVGMLGTYATKFHNVVESDTDLITEIKSGKCEAVRIKN
jgi:predicted metal-dependent phosphoesterase TrpH